MVPCSLQLLQEMVQGQQFGLVRDYLELQLMCHARTMLYVCWCVQLFYMCVDVSNYAICVWCVELCYVGVVLNYICVLCHELPWLCVELISMYCFKFSGSFDNFLHVLSRKKIMATRWSKNKVMEAAQVMMRWYPCARTIFSKRRRWFCKWFLSWVCTLITTLWNYRGSMEILAWIGCIIV